MLKIKSTDINKEIFSFYTRVKVRQEATNLNDKANHLIPTGK